MVVIHKHELHFGPFRVVNLLGHARPLCVGEQHGEIMLWCMTETPLYTPEPPKGVASPFHVLHYRVYPTGAEVDLSHPAKWYLGTVQLPDETVWHVFTSEERAQ